MASCICKRISGVYYELYATVFFMAATLSDLAELIHKQTGFVGDFLIHYKIIIVDFHFCCRSVDGKNETGGPCRGRTGQIIGDH